MKTIVAERVRERIASGTFALGQQLSDKTLAAELATSRTPVREALLALAAEGLVVMRPQSGTFVFEPGVAEIRELCELRSLFEAGAVRIGAARNGAGLAVALGRTVAAARAALAAGDFRQCERLDTEFHESLVALSGNRYLVAAYRGISDKVRALRHRLPQSHERIGNAIADHRRVVELIRGDRVAEAADRLSRHVRNVFALLRRTGDIADPKNIPPSRARLRR